MPDNEATPADQLEQPPVVLPAAPVLEQPVQRGVVQILTDLVKANTQTIEPLVPEIVDALLQVETSKAVQEFKQAAVDPSVAPATLEQAEDAAHDVATVVAPLVPDKVMAVLNAVPSALGSGGLAFAAMSANGLPHWMCSIGFVGVALLALDHVYTIAMAPTPTKPATEVKS